MKFKGNFKGINLNEYCEKRQEKNKVSTLFHIRDAGKKERNLVKLMLIFAGQADWPTKPPASISGILTNPSPWSPHALSRT